MNVAQKLLLSILLWIYVTPVVAVTAEEVKAAYLYNFIKYVEWPSQTQNIASKIIMSLLNAREIYLVLKQKEGELVSGKTILVKEIATIEGAYGSHILFAGGAANAPASIVQDLSQKGVLTIGESPNFAEGKGIIGFVLRGDTVQFEINWERAKKTGFSLSAKLLQSAIIVSEND